MVIKGNVYKFEICYIDNNKQLAKTYMYSDSNSIYELEDLPKTTTSIYCFKKDLNKFQDMWTNEGEYMVGDKITLEEAEEEINKLSKINMPESQQYEKDTVLAKLKAFCKNEMSDVKNENTACVYINKNVALSNSARAINGRLPILPPYYFSHYKFISPNQIINGKIYKDLNVSVKKENKPPKLDEDKPYIGLE